MRKQEKTPPTLGFTTNCNVALRFEEFAALVADHLVDWTCALLNATSFEEVQRMFDIPYYKNGELDILFSWMKTTQEKKDDLAKLFCREGFIGIKFRLSFVEGTLCFYATPNEETQFIRPLTDETRRLFIDLFIAMERNGFGRFTQGKPEKWSTTREKKNSISQEALMFLSEPSDCFY